MNQRRYNGYQGRRTAWDVLRVIVCALVVVLILIAAGLMVGQRYLVYTDDGVRLELPFLRQEETASVDASVPVDIVQLPGKTEPQPEVQPEEENTASDSSEEHQSESVSG